MWKIIAHDNYDRENIADRLVCEFIQNEIEGEVMTVALNESETRDPNRWYQLIPQNQQLWRGMEELV